MIDPHDSDIKDKLLLNGIVLLTMFGYNLDMNIEPYVVYDEDSQDYFFRFGPYSVTTKLEELPKTKLRYLLIERMGKNYYLRIKSTA